MKWYGDPKQDEMEDSGNMTDKEIETVTEQETIRRQPNGQLTGQTVSSTRSNTNTLMDFWSNASARKTARVQRLRASMRFESSGSSVSDFNGSGDEDIELLENPSSRGYLLRLEDLTAKEWKRIFGGLFRFLWPQSKSDGAEKAEDSDDEVEVDNVLVANMCKITKNFVIFPGVLRLICDENEADEKECLLSRLAAHVYNPEIASMLHGLIHLSNRRGFEYFRIIRCLVQLMVEQLPTRLVRSLSSVSSTSTVSSTSSFSPRSSVGGALTIPSSSFFSSKTALLSPLLFTSNTASIVHSRINGCAELLSKILKDEFPNTFRYYIQTKLQLASFESVEPYKRELFPPRMAPSDPVLHHKLKYAVLAALMEDSTVLARLAELGMAELRFLDAHHMNGACIPSVLVIDVLRQAIEFSMHNSEQLKALVAPIPPRSRHHFDSDSDNDETEDEEDFALLAYISGKDNPSMSSERDASFARSTLFMGITPLAISYSPRSGRTIVNHRPLASTLLVMHVVELLDAVILMSNDRIDRRLTRLDISTSLMKMFEKFPTASILHCRLVKLYLNLLNRPSTNGRVNNPLLRSIFRSPNSILEFILRKLDTNTSAHTYDAHLAIIGVKIAKICSSPTLQQELIRQFCNNVKGWNDFASSLVATHSQQMDVLNDSLLGLQVAAGGTRNGDLKKGNTSEEDDIRTGFLLAPAIFLCE
ncbi:unnamed protein product [Peronospora destructor]|uniref:Uncharacterized protein n=1 Tax=Peronospora destructor TaxID=86335 RepID=A0AAV0TJD1_9STRA|nr:unnamed protein product [Peronospora destructor]